VGGPNSSRPLYGRSKPGAEGRKGNEDESGEKTRGSPKRVNEHDAPRSTQSEQDLEERRERGRNVSVPVFRVKKRAKGGEDKIDPEKGISNTSSFEPLLPRGREKVESLGEAKNKF